MGNFIDPETWEAVGWTLFIVAIGAGIIYAIMAIDTAMKTAEG